MKITLHLYIITFFLQTAFPSNILFFHLVASSSHRTSIWPLAEKLAEKGHHVTYIFPMTNSSHGILHHPKIEELTPSKMVPILQDYIGDFDINFRLNNTVDQWTSKLFSKCLQLCESFYDSPEIKEWLARPNLHYDLVMIDALPGDCAYGLVHRFRAKHILFTPVIPHFIWDAIGIVPESSSIPEGLFHKKPAQMTFANRLLGTFATIFWRFEFLNFLTQVEAVIKDKLGAKDMPTSLVEFERNTSLVLVNSYFLDDYPMALPPIVQSYSGLWCSKDKRHVEGTLPSLSKEILTFLNGDAFVYISFGSSVVASSMPPSERDKFFQAFYSFPRLKFLWKWDGQYVPEDTPKNVMLQPWFPQRNILAHGKLKGFITQAGRPSIQEAICYGVPMITIPIFADQDYNADRLEYLGVSINIDIGNMTTEILQNAIKDIAFTDKYTVKVKEISKMFKDRPLDPLENSLFWTEFILRYKGTSLLMPLGVNQTWYQRRLLDVYAIVLTLIMVMMGIFIIILYFTVKFIIKTCKVPIIKKGKQE